MSISSQFLKVAFATVGCVGALGSSGCIEYLEAGEVGQMRYVADIGGAEEFRASAPVADRNGSLYVLFGSRENAQPGASVGYPGGGGWKGLCTIHQNTDRGVHGFVGTSIDHAYYWSGDALVELDGDTSNCRQILRRDPTTRSQLAFKAIVPWLRQTPSRRTLVGLVQAPTDPVPFWVVVDLDVRRYTGFAEFVPRNATQVVSLGTGADPNTDSGFVVVKYVIDETTTRVEARFIDRDAQVGDIVNIGGLEMAEEDAMTGFLQLDDDGWVAGVLETGEVLLFDRNQAKLVTDTRGLTPVGVHRWGDQAFLVGTANGRPALAEIGPGGSIQSPIVWTASERTAAALRGNVLIQDDRLSPVRTMTWTNPTQAFGEFPFMYPNSPSPYAVDTSLLEIAGPAYETAGETYTSVAVGPVGLTYP